jgi:hypothetical protein
MVSRNSSTQPPAIIGAAFCLPPAHCATRTSGAASEAAASSPILGNVSRRAGPTAGRVRRGADGCSAAAPQPSAHAAQPRSASPPGW